MDLHGGERGAHHVVGEGGVVGVHRGRHGRHAGLHRVAEQEHYDVKFSLVTLKHGSNSECLHQRTPRELCNDDFEIREDRYMTYLYSVNQV